MDISPNKNIKTDVPRVNNVNTNAHISNKIRDKMN